MTKRRQNPGKKRVHLPVPSPDEQVVIYGERGVIIDVTYDDGWKMLIETDDEVKYWLREDEDVEGRWLDGGVEAEFYLYGDPAYTDIDEGAKVTAPASDRPDDVVVVGAIEEGDEYPIKLSSPVYFGGTAMEAVQPSDLDLVDDEGNPRIIPEEVYERRRRRAREAAAGRVDPSEYQVSEEYMAATGSVAAQLRGEREEVIPAKKRKQKGKKRIVIERAKNLRQLKTKLLR